MAFKGCATLTVWAVIALAFAEPTPEPSVEPSTITSSPSPSSTSTTDSSDLMLEGQDQVAILKQINRVNDDGSYTFGYEAADGSFKIETRDVAGNVKGMFGFVDEAGELKRVSYSASNGTGFQSTGTPNIPPLVTPAPDSTTRLPLLSSGGSTTRISLLPSSTTERPQLPVYIYKTTTRAPRPEVIQHIPKIRPTPGSVTVIPTETERITTTRKPAFGNLAPKKSSTPNYISLNTPTEDDDDNDRSPVVQIIRPRGYKKVVVTKRPVEVPTSTIAPSVQIVPVTYNSLQNEDEFERQESQRQVDSNTVTDSGLITSGTEDSPDVFGGSPTPRPYPSNYNAIFPQLPQYQRILQTSFLQGQNPYGPPINDPRLASPDPRYPPTAAGDPRLASPDPRYSPTAAGDPRLPSPDPRYPPTAAGDPRLPVNGRPIPINGNIPSRFQDPASIAQFAQFSGRAYPPQSYPVGAGRALDGRQLPAPIPPSPQDYPQIPTGRALYPKPTSSNSEAPLPFPGDPRVPERPTQRLPPASYNPNQGLPPDSDNVNPDIRRPSPVPQPYPQPYPNVPYPPEQGNPQTFLMEQILRMLLASRNQPYQGPPQQLSPFQQALISTLGQGNIPPELLAQNNDPRNAYGAYQQRNPYYREPPFDPRYSGYPGYNDPYANPYGNRYNPYYQQNYYQGYPPNPYGYTPNPYYNNYGPEETLLRMFFGPRFPYPAPQPNPQIQQSPAAFDRPDGFRPRQPIPPEPNDPNNVFGQRLPGGGNAVVERSPQYGRSESATRRSLTRSKGSRNVQIIDPSASESSTTTAKPR